MRLFLFHSVLAMVAVYLYFRHVETVVPYSAISASTFFAALFFLLWLTSFFYSRTYFRKLPKFFSFLLFFFKELLVANLKIAYDIITPHYYMRPSVIALPLKARSDLEITILANIISLTPGTLSIDVSKDRKMLYVHALYVKHNDLEKLKLHIKNGFERRLLELTA